MCRSPSAGMPAVPAGRNATGPLHVVLDIIPIKSYIPVCTPENPEHLAIAVFEVVPCDIIGEGRNLCDHRSLFTALRPLNSCGTTVLKRYSPMSPRSDQESRPSISTATAPSGSFPPPDPAASASCPRPSRASVAGVQNSSYWTSTSYPDQTFCAWHVNFNYPIVNITAHCSRVLDMDGGRVAALGPTVAVLNDLKLMCGQADGVPIQRASREGRYSRSVTPTVGFCVGTTRICNPAQRQVTPKKGRMAGVMPATAGKCSSYPVMPPTRYVKSKVASDHFQRQGWRAQPR